MPRYYFYIHDGSDVQDHEGVELDGMEAARSYGVALAGEIIRDAGLRGSPQDDWDVLVTDRVGLILFRMAFLVSDSAMTAGRGAAGRIKHLTAS